MERFIKIEGHSNYEVSNKGNVRNVKTERVLVPCYTKMGYQQVNLVSDNGIIKKFYIHRLVAEGFIPNPHNYTIINHINAVKDNNEDINLEWCTQAHNVRQAWEMGICKCKNVVYIKNEDLVGKTFKSNFQGEYTVMSIYKKIKNIQYFVIKFHDTNNEKVVAKTQIQNNKVGDYNFTVYKNNLEIVNPTPTELVELINGTGISIGYVRRLLSEGKEIHRVNITIVKTTNYKVGA